MEHKPHRSGAQCPGLLQTCLTAILTALCRTSKPESPRSISSAGYTVEYVGTDQEMIETFYNLLLVLILAIIPLLFGDGDSLRIILRSLRDHVLGAHRVYWRSLALLLTQTTPERAGLYRGDHAGRHCSGQCYRFRGII